MLEIMQMCKWSEPIAHLTHFILFYFILMLHWIFMNFQPCQFDITHQTWKLDNLLSFSFMFWRPQALLRCQKPFSSQCRGQIPDIHYPQSRPYNTASGQQTNQMSAGLQEEENWWNPIRVIINTRIIGQAASHSASQLFSFSLWLLFLWSRVLKAN